MEEYKGNQRNTMTTDTDGSPIHRVVERDVEELVGGEAEIAGPEEDLR